MNDHELSALVAERVMGSKVHISKSRIDRGRVFLVESGLWRMFDPVLDANSHADAYRKLYESNSHATTILLDDTSIGADSAEVAFSLCFPDERRAFWTAWAEQRETT